MSVFILAEQLGRRATARLILKIEIGRLLSNAVGYDESRANILDSPGRPSADGDLDSPKWDQLSYLADYVYSEVPPDRKSAGTVLDSLKDIPIGTPVEEINRITALTNIPLVP